MIEQILKAKAAYKQALKDYVTLSYCGIDELSDEMNELDALKAGVLDNDEMPCTLLLVSKDLAKAFLEKHKGKGIRVAGPLAFPIDRIIGPDEVHTCTTTAKVNGELTKLEIVYKPHPLLVSLVSIQGQPVEVFCAKHEIDLYRLEDDVDAHYSYMYKAF